MGADRVLVDPVPTRDLGLRLIATAQRLDDLLPELRGLVDQVQCSPAPTHLAQVLDIARGTGNDLTWLADEVARIDGGRELTIPNADLRTARLDAQHARSCPDEPPPPRNPVVEFFDGAWDTVRETSDQLGDLTTDVFFDPGQWWTNWTEVPDDLLHAITHPGDLYDAVVDPDLFWENPARWFGARVPDAVGAVLGGSSITARTTTLSVVDLPDPPLVRAPDGAERWGLPDGALLENLGDGTFRSRNGLVYGADLSGRYQSRVDHVRAHGADIPDRPVHGVFTGDPIAVTDEAWARVLDGGAVVVEHGNRTLYYVDMDRVVGYVGGQAGAAAGHPAASYVAIVTQPGARVVTAYPVDVVPGG